MTTSAELRSKFLEYFKGHQHSIVPSSPLVPGNDPTLLFTNAGMVQFKDVFLGTDKRNYKTAATSQRCVRAGGKHNDLENVGYTARHHTFFEMLGNFSFGDYFKETAIFYAWDFLTRVIGLPAEKLWITIYSEDDESADIWLNKIGVDPKRFTRISTSDNFWSMGDTGPCGPCSEIFYDHGAEVAGGPPGTPEEDGDRYIEIWNLVFMQYNRDQQGKLNPLPKPSVDTGMGLERLAAILQNVHNNYDIDLFQSLIKSAAKLTNTNDISNKSLRVIADHIRACAFLIVDGVLPSNEGRGYVLRRIIRRALRHGYKLDCNQAFFYKLVPTLEKLMGEAYPELTKQQKHVAQVLQKEEARFAETLSLGMRILEQSIESLDGNVMDGALVFKLYDTFGFPFDLTADVARERGLKIDQAGFEIEMEAQKNRARTASQFGAVDKKIVLKDHIPTSFLGYEHHQCSARVMAIIQNNQPINTLNAGEQAIIIVDQTPFYAESGGQVGDIGVLANSHFKFQVNDTQKQNDIFLHIGQLHTGQIHLGDTLNAEIDQTHRQAVMLNHSATHLVHEALRQQLGNHVQQKGSLVDAEKLRFDFSHHQPLTHSEITNIETWVNQQIRLNLATGVELMDIEAAKKAGAMALFGEKYGDIVRVLRIGSDSVELCGGTHVQRSGDIGLLKIVLETGTASGVRRIEAITGQQALQRFISSENTINQTTQILKTNREELIDKITQLQTINRTQEKQIETLKLKAASQAGGDLASQAVEIKGIKVLAAVLEAADAKVLRNTVDQLKTKLSAAAIVLASTTNGKVTIIAGVTKAKTNQIQAGDLAKFVAEQCGGKGGGKADMAQGGGTQPENIDKALASVASWVENQL